MFGFFARTLYAHMQQEIDWLREQLRYEKQRGDRAFDQLATLQVGRPVVTALPAQPAEDQSAALRAETERAIAEVTRSDPWANLGTVETG